MNTYYVKLLLFTFLINALILSHYENFVNNYYNVSLIQNNVKRTSIKSRLLAQTQKHNPHYHNDPELKEIIDKLNDKAIKKYQQNHEPYEQLRELVEKNGKKVTAGHDAEHMSMIEKDLLKTYEEVFGEENHIMLKSSMYPNDDHESDDSSSCECTDNNNMKVARTKGKDKYLKHLKGRCTRGIYFCSLGSVILTYIGLNAAKNVAINYLSSAPVPYNACTSSVNMYNIFVGSAAWGPDAVGTVPAYAIGALQPWGIAALVLLILAVALIILYIWLYRRRKRSWKHECKKHLCK
ncbi:PIR protein [Plasmodium reichenowi]|uniref:PIR protein n=1 Tax=Plasmodium reichenowi TaxID=5854 RepID=A0A2P9DSG9_PLARE|nr:PIR protein [Plasmodium reichenowi]